MSKPIQCEVDGCTRPVICRHGETGKYVCRPCYNRYSSRGTFALQRRSFAVPIDGPCQVPGCPRLAMQYQEGRKVCEACARYYQRNGTYERAAFRHAKRYIGTEAVYAQFVAFYLERGYPPSVRGLADHSGGRSTSVITFHLRKLVDNGRLVHVDGHYVIPRQSLEIRLLGRNEEPHEGQAPIE